MIAKAALGARHFIAEGGVGRVYRVPDFQLPGHPPLAYKEIRNDIAPAMQQEALDAMTRSVAFRDALSLADQADLDEYSTWPIKMVEDGGAPCGLVMPLIPPDFFLRTKPQTGTAKDIPFELSWLCAKDAQAQVEGIDRSGVQSILVRIALLAQLVYAIGRLHKHGAVYGDISLKNAALAVGPPRVKLLDCDAAAALTDITRVQLHTPFFKPPEMIAGTHKLQDYRTDVFKLGLCIIRGLQQGPGITQTKDPAGLIGKLDAQALDVVTRAVGDDRAQRPSAKELFQCLERNLLAQASPPTLHSATLSRTTMLRGQDVEVVWAASGGIDVRILGPNGLEIKLPDTGASPVRHVLTPAVSGAIEVEVGNRHGTARAVAGIVDLYELPPFNVNLNALPRPVLPSLPAIARPAALSSPPPVPQLAMPPVAPIVDALAQARMIASPIARVDTAVLDAGRAVRRCLDAATGDAALSGTAMGATQHVRAVLDDALRDLRERTERQVAASRMPGGMP